MIGRGRPSIEWIACTSRVDDVRKASSDVAEPLHRDVDLRDLVAEQLADELAGDAGQAAGRERGSDEPAVEADEDVGARPLAERADGVGEDRLAGAALVGVGQRDDVLGVRGGFEPGDGAALVARPRRGDHRGRGRPVVQVAGGHQDGGGGAPAVGRRAVRRRPVTVRRNRPRSTPLASTTACIARRSAWSSIGTVSPRPAADRRSRPRWRRMAKGVARSTCRVSNTPSPTVIPWSKAEHAGLPGHHQLTVEPHDLVAGAVHHPRTLARPGRLLL